MPQEQEDVPTTQRLLFGTGIATGGLRPRAATAAGGPVAPRKQELAPAEAGQGLLTAVQLGGKARSALQSVDPHIRTFCACIAVSCKEQSFMGWYKVTG